MTYQSRPLSEHTTDTLLELLAWVKYRRAYCIQCGRTWPVDDIAFEDAVCSELGKRI